MLKFKSKAKVAQYTQSQWSYKNPPKLRPIPRGGSALIPVATSLGWTNPVTGELLVSIPGLATTNADAIVVPTFTLTLPANATYVTGQTLTFTVTSTETLVITGLPTLAITLTSGATVATYDPVNSTGTSLLFKYTVLLGDMAMSGIALAGAITIASATSSKNADRVVDVLNGNRNERLRTADRVFTVGSTALVKVNGV